MAYACPVCEALVPDAEHLAHHLAVVALTRGGDHAAWLDDTVPDWQDCEPAALGDAAVEHAEEVAHELVDEPDGSGRPAGAAADAAADARAHAPFGGSRGDDGVDAETAAILEEARELTRQRRGNGDGGDVETTDDGDVGARE